MASGQNRLRLLLVLFVSCNWMLDLVAVRLALIGQLSAAKPILLGLIFAQIGLLGCWMAIYPRKIAAQTMLLVASAAVLAQPLARYSPLPDKQWWGVFAVFLAVAAMGSWAMRNNRIAAALQAGQSSRGRAQMSIGGLFAITTTTAIGTAVAPHVHLPSLNGLLLGASLGLAFLAGLNLTLSTFGLKSSLISLVGFAAATITWLPTGESIRTLVTAGLTQTSVVLVAGLLLRMATETNRRPAKRTAASAFPVQDAMA